MYALLLGLGAAITVAGIVLLGAGVPIGARPYDPTIITPGAVAIVGGLVLLGLGFTLRVLGRIERALATQPAPRPYDGAVQGAGAAGKPVPASVILPPPLPTQPVLEPHSQPMAGMAAPSVTVADAVAQQRLHEKFPALGRLDGAGMVEEDEVSLLPKPPNRADAVPDLSSAVASAAAPARAVTQPGRGAVPRRDPAGRSIGWTDRTRSLDAVWPKRPMPMRTSPPSPAAMPPAEPSTPIEPALPFEPAPPPLPARSREPAMQPHTNGAAAAMPVPVSILKSGIVDGMAYTVYSDGSIEAQLPEGTLRFNSITELRHHVEQNS
jgi:hypothetical protein